MVFRLSLSCFQETLSMWFHTWSQRHFILPHTQAQWSKGTSALFHKMHPGWAVDRASPSGCGWWELSAPLWHPEGHLLLGQFNIFPLTMCTQRTLWQDFGNANGRRNKESREMEMGPILLTWGLSLGPPGWSAVITVPLPARLEGKGLRGFVLCLAQRLFLKKVSWVRSWIFCCSLSPGMPYPLWQPYLFAGLTVITPILL